jgi:hypothetical protein
MTSRAGRTMIVAAIAVGLVWASSPWLVGQREPWDADVRFYPFALFVVGSLAGLLSPRPLWAHYVGSVVGAVAYEVLRLSVGPLFVLGMAFQLGYSLVFLVAAAVAGQLRARLGVPASRVST